MFNNKEFRKALKNLKVVNPPTFKDVIRDNYDDIRSSISEGKSVSEIAETLALMFKNDKSALKAGTLKNYLSQIKAEREASGITESIEGKNRSKPVERPKPSNEESLEPTNNELENNLENNQPTESESESESKPYESEDEFADIYDDDE